MKSPLKIDILTFQLKTSSKYLKNLGLSRLFLWVDPLFFYSILMLLSMAFPNLLGCYFLSNEVAADLSNYWQRLTSGEMLANEPVLGEK